MPLRFRILPPPGAAIDAAAPAAGSVAERTFELTEDLAEVRLGRQPAFEIELPFPAVSVFHARLFRGESAHEWWLEDQGSSNGTWLEGVRLAPRRAGGGKKPARGGGREEGKKREDIKEKERGRQRGR